MHIQRPFLQKPHHLQKSLPPCPDTLFLIMSMVAVYLFNQPCCDLDQATNQAKNNPAKEKKKRLFLTQISFPIQFTSEVHALLYQLIDRISGDWNKQQKAMAAVQNSTARKGYGHETIWSSCKEHLAAECLELHFNACPKSPAL